MAIAGFHLPKIHLLERRLVPIDLRNMELRRRFDSSVRKYDLRRAPWSLGDAHLLRDGTHA